MRILVLALAAALAAAAPSAAREVRLMAEHSEVVRLPAPAYAVIIGNPAIADAVIHDRSTLILTGKVFGRTNVIALDRAGRVIYAQDIVVGPASAGALVYYRGAARQTYSCTPDCQPNPTIGDSDATFGTALGQQQDRSAAAQSAASGG